MMYGWHDGWSGFLWMVVFWGALIGILYLIVRGVSRASATSPTTDGARDPIDILDERFARGEISEQEYADRRRVLERSRQAVR